MFQYGYVASRRGSIKEANGTDIGFHENSPAPISFAVIVITTCNLIQTTKSPY